jgi:hypothetical protein
MESEPDQLSLLRDILALKIIVDRELLTAGEILADPYGNPAKRDALEREGVKKCGGYLLVATRLMESRLRGTVWEHQNIHEILARLPRAAIGRDKRYRFGGVRHYPVAIPWEIVDQFLTDDGEEVTDDF